MKKTQKLFLALAIVMSCGIFSASGQIYVHVRPVGPVVVRTEAPSPAHVWVGEDWRERDGRYEYSGGRWEAPPRHGDHYRAGHWSHGSHGHTWHQGGWRH